MAATEAQTDRPVHRVLVLDSRRLIREGVAEILSASTDLEVVAICDELPDDATASVIVVGRATIAIPSTCRTVMLHHIAEPRALIAAVRTAAGSAAASSSAGTTGGLPRSLTKRELMVLRAVSVGDSAVEIGAALQISPRTVERHKQITRAKLGGQSHAVAIARERGLLDEPT